MRFRMTHLVFGTPDEFDEENAPDWLTSRHTIEGSTMDDGWFWREEVLTLPVGGKAETDFWVIERIA